MNYLAMLALLKALTQEVNLLELQLAQLQASSVVATTTPIFYPTYSPPVVNPVQDQPILGDAPSTPESCTLTATDIGSTSSPQTALSWTLTGFPTSSSVVWGNLSPWNEPNPPITFNGQTVEALPSVAYGLHAGTQVVNNYFLESQAALGSNESQKLINGWYPGIEANFGGTTCSVIPEPQPF